ncbi:hypothetical protein V8F20_005434 [Naviculisporaceae sp. PSN 640]
MMKMGEASVPGSLPLRARVGIRDHWDSENAVFKKRFGSLVDALGFGVVVNPEWQLLLAELDGVFPTAGDQVANIAEICDVWAQAMLDLLEPEDDWADNLVDEARNSGGVLRLFIDVNGKLDTAAVQWSKTRGGFVITLPKQRIHPIELLAIFRGQLESCFDVKAKQELPVEGDLAGADDWADVGVEETTSDHRIRPVAAASTQNQSGPSAFLPSATSIPRPDELLLKPPYHLHVRQAGRGQIEIQGSHSPSLKLLADYLKRWCRVNHQDTTKPQAIAVTLHQSPFALGQMYDRLTLAPHDHRYMDRFQPTVPMLLALIEKELGYVAVLSQSQGDNWYFRRDAPIVSTGL